MGLRRRRIELGRRRIELGRRYKLVMVKMRLRRRIELVRGAQSEGRRDGAIVMVRMGLGNGQNVAKKEEV